jgi:hypothetical protein
MSYRALGIEPIQTYRLTSDGRWEADTRSWAERHRTGLVIGAGVAGLFGLLAFSWWAESRIEESIRKESGESGVQAYRMTRLGTSLMMMPLWWR